MNSTHTTPDSGRPSGSSRSEGGRSGRDTVDGGSVFTGPDVDRATEDGLRALNVDPEDVEVRVLDRGSRGFLGFGARPAKVALVPRHSFVDVVEDLARGILSRMELDATVRATQAGLDVEVEIDCPGADGLLIGRKGETLAAFEHILHRMAARKVGARLREVRVDVAGYRERREAQLTRDAMALADRVRRSGRRAMTEPLLPGERRIVHRALDGAEGVRTHVTGSGANRRVVVMPAGAGLDSESGSPGRTRPEGTSGARPRSRPEAAGGRRRRP